MAATTDQFVTERMRRFRLPPTPFRLPGVYRPQADTHLLASVVAGTVTRSTGRVLDICTGTGA
ncbi:MAG TPA: hypothetical protein VHF06_38370, partial [Pseudonocardiaceae bacterium]|nr:hypothetical protein [Pseudonocardiaceae bacterium]